MSAHNCRLSPVSGNSLNCDLEATALLPLGYLQHCNISNQLLEALKRAEWQQNSITSGKLRL